MSDQEERRVAEHARRIAGLSNMLDTEATRQELLAFAKYRRAKYLALVEAGFNAGQALYLCCQRD